MQKRFKRPFTEPNQSILHTVWTEPDRPYSQNELRTLEKELNTKLQLDTIGVRHQECGHAYLIKKNGVRSKEIRENYPNDIYPDVGNCSVCWKKSKTPRELLPLANEFISLVLEYENSPRTFYTFMIKTIFYTWLYDEAYRY